MSPDGNAPGPAACSTAKSRIAGAAGVAILSIIGGAQGSDAATLAHKVAVGNYYDLRIFKHDAPFTIASADAAIAPVTSSDASVTSAKAAVDAYAAVASQEVGLIGLSGATDVHV